MVAAHAAKSTAKRWLGDAGTYPVIVTCAIASGLCIFQCGRQLLAHPEVTISKADRNNAFHHQDEVGADYRAHRRGFATLTKNRINESKGLNKE